MEEKDFSIISTEEVISTFQTDSENGLSQTEALSRLKKYGRNELPQPKKFSTWIIFFRQFSSPLIWFLMIGALIAALLGEWIQMSAIWAILFLNAVIGFFQEYSAERSFKELQKLSLPNSKVLRDGNVKEIPSYEIVPGDVVILESGDHVPADGRVIYIASLAIQESALTGESLPVHKISDPIQQMPIADQKNMVFSGTHVVNGKGKIIITLTGEKSQLGKIASSLQMTKELTPLQLRFNRLAKQLIFLCLCIIGVISLLGFWKNLTIVEIALTSLSLAVAAIPEGLPAIVTVTLAVGVRKMAKRNALIRRLASVETLGCTTVICSDKTGTLTQNEMVVKHLWVGGRLFEVSGESYEPKGEFKEKGIAIDVSKFPELLEALKIGCLCNDATLNQENDKWKIFGDPTEGSLLVAAAKADLWKEKLEGEAPLIGEIPFDSNRKMMSAFRKDSKLYVKGALEHLLAHCDEIVWDGKKEKISDEKRQIIEKTQIQLASDGFRILALATKELPLSTSIDPSIENNLIFVGFVAMLDPPKPGVEEAIAACKNAHMIPIMITGDHKITATAIAKQIGLMEPDSIVLEGKEIDAMDETHFNKAVLKTAIFARVNPNHKLRIIEAFKSHGHVVAMTGDGVNDAPAIKKADIGISMGITGTEVTKQVSDMVILDDHFASIVAAVQEGRAIYNNIVKFVRFLVSANLAELMVIFFSILWGYKDLTGHEWAILLPSQILWINLVTDGFPALALAFDPIEKKLMRHPPRKLSEPILSTVWVTILVAISILMSIAAITAGHLGFQESRSLGQTMAFTELVILELGILFVIRMNLSLNKYLIWAIILSILMQLLVIYTPSMRIPFGTTPLISVQWIQIIGLAFTVHIVSFITFYTMKKMKKL